MKSISNGAGHPSLKSASEANINRLLRELHEKKRWLDTMIEGLEAAVGSPHHQLIERAAQMFDHLQGERPKVDLRPQQQRALAALASQVGRRPRRVVRSDAKAA